MMIQTLTDKGDYVVLTKEEYEMMKIPVSSTPKHTLAEKLSESLRQSQRFEFPRHRQPFTPTHVQFSKENAGIRMPSPLINPTDSRAALNVTTSNIPSLNIPKIPQFSGDEPAQKVMCRLTCGFLRSDAWSWMVRCRNRFCCRQ